ncbi:PspA/IM30 family protein [Pseudoalteromonas luteoviolacea]|uniref:PspA/IM30 family protein n=1 Tax=Pseudoalteromonas luteoviolacea TaxID=43657 RepID=UPI001F2ECAF4|nr:PspA/IM30 family protein [Pseudoalteromonas luteoviolacea]MCF6441093.1 PspA/IM30 family protein [Pseudoalteromonas luteoviolacea]
MALINRIEDLIKSEFNTLLGDACSSERCSPNINNTSERIQALIIQLKTEASLARKQVVNYEGAIAEWYEKAQYALEKGREDLAKAALNERYSCQNKLSSLKTHLENLSQALHKLEQDHRTLQSGQKRDVQGESRRHIIKEECLRARLKLKQVLHGPDMQGLASHISEWERKLTATELPTAPSFSSPTRKKIDELNRLIQHENVTSMLQSLKQKLVSASSSKSLSQ